MLKLPRRRIRGQPLQRERPLAFGGPRRQMNQWRHWGVAIGGLMVMAAAAGVVTIASRPRADAERMQASPARPRGGEAPAERKAERPPPKSETSAALGPTARLEPPRATQTPVGRPATAPSPNSSQPLEPQPAPPRAPALLDPALPPATASLAPVAPLPRTPLPEAAAPAAPPEEPNAVSSLGPATAPKPASGLAAAVANGQVALGSGVSTACLAPELQNVLAEVAARFGRVTIVSTHELNTDNHSVGSVRHKLHTACKAVDFKTQRSVTEVTAFLRTRPEVAGINSYRNNGLIHIDLNESKVARPRPRSVPRAVEQDDEPGPSAPPAPTASTTIDPARQ